MDSTDGELQRNIVSLPRSDTSTSTDAYLWAAAEGGPASSRSPEGGQRAEGPEEG